MECATDPFSCASGQPVLVPVAVPVPVAALMPAVSLEQAMSSADWGAQYGASTGPRGSLKRRGSPPEELDDDREAKLRRQQEQNKAAQARYRQRRRERQESLEAELAEHQQRLRTAATRAQSLEARVAALEGQLAAAAAAQTTEQTPEPAPAPAAATAGAAAPAAAAAAAAAAAPAAPATVASVSQARLDYCRAIAGIQAFVRQHGLRDLLKTDLLAPLTERVQACAAACAAAIDVSSPGTLQLLVDAAGTGGCCVDAGCCGPAAAAAPGAARRGVEHQRWLQAIADVALNDSQITEILAMRTDVLRALNNCFAEREAIAERLLAAAASPAAGPAASGAGAGAAAGAGGAATSSGGAGGAMGGGAGLTPQADAMRKAGYLREVARGSLSVWRMLHDLQTNLATEGRLLREFTLRMMTRVLAPVQAAVMAAESFPYASDALGLANSLHKVYSMAPHLAPLLPGGSRGGSNKVAAAPSAPLIAAAAAAAAAALRDESAGTGRGGSRSGAFLSVGGKAAAGCGPAAPGQPVSGSSCCGPSTGAAPTPPATAFQGGFCSPSPAQKGLRPDSPTSALMMPTGCGPAPTGGGCWGPAGASPAGAACCPPSSGCCPPAACCPPGAPPATSAACCPPAAKCAAPSAAAVGIPLPDDLPDDLHDFLLDLMEDSPAPASRAAAAPCCPTTAPCCSPAGRAACCPPVATVAASGPALATACCGGQPCGASAAAAFGAQIATAAAAASGSLDDHLMTSLELGADRLMAC